MSDLRTRSESLAALLAGEQGEASLRPLIEATIALCDELLLAGGATVALGLLEQARRHRAALAPETTLRLDVVHVAALKATGAYAAALEAAERIESEYEAPLSRLAQVSDRLQAIKGACLWNLNRADEATALLRAARDRLLTRPDSALLVQCTIDLASAHWLLGEYESASRLALDGLIAARRSGNRYYEAVALMACAINARRECRWAETSSALHEAHEILEGLGSRFQANGALYGLALLHWRRGHLDLALQLADRCLREVAEQAGTMLRSHAHLAKAVILTHMGKLEEAEEALGDPPPLGAPGESRAALFTTEYLADIQLERGDVGGALARYEEVHAKALAIAPRGDIVGDMHARRAECHLRLGRAEDAYAGAQTALEHRRGLGELYEVAATHRLLALGAAAVGRPDEAKKWFDDGFACYEEIGTPYEWGRLWLAYGDWLLGSQAGFRPDRDGAIEAYGAARDLFERMGAAARLDEATRRLETLGGRRSPAPGTDATSAPEAGDGPATRAIHSRPTRPHRRAELARRSAWAMETFRLVTRDPALLALLEDVAKLAKSQAPILLLGESGTGKELVAQGVHGLSGRRGPFRAINAAALPREIVESELFGHVAGSFTGATRDKTGIFEACHHGTVFLDEIAEMPAELQSRLLRFLETGEVRRVGANDPVRVDTRIVAATNRPRQELMQEGRLRHDVYYRLAHAVITLPPLRQRGDDLELLVGHFLAESCAEAGRRVSLSPAALRRLVEYPWPGNVRQLRSAIQGAVLLAPEGREVAPSEMDLPDVDVPVTLNDVLKVEARRLVEAALVRAGGSKTEAARQLGVPRTTLFNRLRRLGIA